VSTIGKSSRETLATALARLKKLQRKWKKVKVARTMNVVGGAKYYESYLATRERAKSIAAKLFIDEFASLASNITESNGLRRVPRLRAGSR
jgi:hypothetical protein